MLPETWPYFLNIVAEPAVLWLQGRTHCAERMGGPGALPRKAAAVTRGLYSSKAWPTVDCAVTWEVAWPGVKIAKYVSGSLALRPQLCYLLTSGLAHLSLKMSFLT